MYELIKKDGLAKRGRLHTVHGVIETPVFMNVGTAAAIKGAVATTDLQEIKTQVELSNTYHLHVRPGDEVVKKLGGIGTSRFLPIRADFRCFHLRDCAESKKRECISIPILTDIKYLWGQKRVCGFSRIWHLR